ncbi:MAG: cell division protein FtsQ/DivIB [Pyrinomonadaceae bacterium]
MATRTRNSKRPTNSPTTAKRRKTRARGKSRSGAVVQFLVSLFFVLCIVFCLGFLVLMGYRTVTASSFFDAKTIDIRGVERVSRDGIEKIVRIQTERSGVWNSDLEAIRSEIEKMAYVKSVAVSRVLPGGIQVRVEERIPKALVRFSSGDFWVDETGSILGAVEKNEQRPDFIMRGWDESKTARADKDNQERVKLYQKLQTEWQDLEIANRVNAVNLADLQDPQAIVTDSGASVSIYLGKEDFGKRLQKGLEVITGKGNKIESLISHGASVVAKYRNS